MQEEVDSRTVALVISSAKLTGRVFKTAIDRYIAYSKNKKLQKQMLFAFHFCSLWFCQLTDLSRPPCSPCHSDADHS